MKYSFTIFAIPVAKERARTERHRNRKTGQMQTRSRTPAKTVKWEKLVADYGIGARQGQQMLQGAMRLSVIFCVPYPKNLTVKSSRTNGLTPGCIQKRKTAIPTKADLSNYIKSIEDGLEGILFKNDSHITEYGKMQKRYSDHPRVDVLIEEIE